MKSSTTRTGPPMAKRKEQTSTSATKVGEAGPEVVNVSGAHWPGTEEVTRYAGPQHQERPTAAHRKPVMIDHDASNRSVELTEACLAGAGRHVEMRAAMRAATENTTSAPMAQGTIRFLTGLWPVGATVRK